MLVSELLSTIISRDWYLEIMLAYQHLLETIYVSSNLGFDLGFVYHENFNNIIWNKRNERPWTTKNKESKNILAKQKEKSKRQSIITIKLLIILSTNRIPNFSLLKSA